VVGLVAITPAAGYVSPASAIVIGALGAVASFAAIRLRTRTRVDDALDVFACHGVAGIVGALATGVFATRAVNPAGADGLIAGGTHLIVAQLVAVVATMGYAALVTGGLFVALGATGLLRLRMREELGGVDIAEHGEHGYHDGESFSVASGRSRLGDAVLVSALGDRRQQKERQA
jgi:Amt family ammonium transporter